MKFIQKKLKEYYIKDLNKIYKFLTPPKVSIARINSSLRLPKNKVDYMIIDNAIGDIKDIQSFVKRIRSLIKDNGRLIITYYNHFWEPFLKISSLMGLREIKHAQNWLDNEDVSNILNLEGFEVINRQKRLLLPIDIPLITNFINNFVSKLPLINNLCLTTFIIAKPKANKIKEFTVSIIVPARNESGNIPNIAKSIPKFGKSQEIIFIEGNSKDDTWMKIKDELKKKASFKIKAFKQRGKGKADAVHLGFKKATGEILMIYDADMTVDPKDLPKFYNSLSQGLGDFANGSRLVYPMEKDAMRTLNKIGNKIFGFLFTWTLGQKFKDTLCGTKAIFRKDYLNLVKVNKTFGDFDPFGDFELIFGAVKLNLKVTEIPVRYKERVYGSTNISRFIHGLLLFKMTLKAYKIFKAW